MRVIFKIDLERDIAFRIFPQPFCNTQNLIAMSLIKRRRNSGGLSARQSSMSDFFDIDKLFDMDDWFSRDWVPACNVQDNPDSYDIEVAAPGMTKEDFNVSVKEGVMTISSEQEEEKEEKTKNYTRREFSTRAFRREFTLPKDANENDVKAKYEKGILKIAIGKLEEAKSKPSKTVPVE